MNIVCGLDEYKGLLLRDLYNAITQIVNGIFLRTINTSTRFIIENVESE